MRPQLRVALLVATAALGGCAGDRQFDEGMEQYQAGRYQHTIRLFDIALEKNPESAKAYLWRAHALANMGDRDRAAADYRRSAELAPDLPDAHYGLGYLHVELGRPESALEYFAEALKADASHFPSLVERSNVLSKKGRYEEAIADLDRAIAIKPDDGGLHRARGAARVKLERHRGAIEDYDAAVAAGPDGIDVRSERAHVHYLLGDHQAALSDLEFAVARAGQVAYPYNNLAWFLVTTPQEALRDGKRAMMLTERAMQLERKTPNRELQRSLASTRAAVFAELGDFRSAVSEQEKAIALAEQVAPQEIEEQRLYLARFKAKERLVIGSEKGFY